MTSVVIHSWPDQHCKAFWPCPQVAVHQCNCAKHVSDSQPWATATVGLEDKTEDNKVYLLVLRMLRIKIYYEMDKLVDGASAQ